MKSPPVTVIAATRAIRVVVIPGRFHDDAALDEMLRATAEAVARMPTPPASP